MDRSKQTDTHSQSARLPTASVPDRNFPSTPLAGKGSESSSIIFRLAKKSLYARLGVRPFINAVGTLTTLSGTLMSPEVVRAMEQASRNFVAIHELQAKAGEMLCQLTSAPAAFVTTRASAALCLASCAVTAGSDRNKMLQRPT
jgi:hypothetical protein